MIPSVSPTVPIAEAVSNMHVRSGRDSAMLMIMAPWHNPFTPEIDEGYERAKAEAMSETVIDYWIPDEDENPDPPYDYPEDDPFDATEWERENLKQTSL